MANPWRGDVDVVLDGSRHVARLTLGALAELETALKTDSLVSLVGRFEAGNYSSRDVLAVVVAGLRGGGWQGRSEDLTGMQIEGGPLAAAQIAARLLTQAFALPSSDE